MKKILIYLIAFIFICFIIPIIFTKQTTNTSTNVLEENQMSKENENNEIKQEVYDKAGYKEYNYKNYGTIRLLHVESSNVEEVNIDDYLCLVVSAEMPASYNIEALKAQAIVARTYTIYKILNKKHNNADMCDDSTCCQAWISKEDRLAKWEESQREANWKKIEDAVYSTRGMIVTYNNQVINAFFHSNSGGVTEIPINVWGGDGYPYLQSVTTSGEDNYTQFSSEIVLTNEQLIEKLKSKYDDISIDFSNQEDINILEHTESGRVKTIKFGNHNLSGVEARTLLGLKSTNFQIEYQDGKIKFVVTGYGHGVGMSQTGADSMAKQGNNYEEIIKHFYTGVEIKDVNSL